MNAALDTRRRKAAEEFRIAGVPHRRVEAWKYSDLRAAVDVDEVAQTGAAQWNIVQRSGDVEVFDLAGGDAPDWVERHLGSLHGESVMGAASLAFARTGFALKVAKTGEVRVDFASGGQARVLIVLEDGATLNYLESVDGADFQNIGMEFVVGAGAHLTHARVARENAEAVQVTDVSVSVARQGSYRLHCTHLGARLSRLELHVALNGENAQAHLSGVSVLGDGLHADVTTHVDHAVGNTSSTQLFKHVAGGKSRAVYQGKITVREGADGSDSRQTAKVLLLGERAEADLKPELEIFADDVKCAHGAAVGDLDQESLFYLRARGITESDARSLLIRAFLEEAVDGVKDDAMRAFLWQAAEAALPRAMESGT